MADLAVAAAAAPAADTLVADTVDLGMAVVFDPVVDAVADKDTVVVDTGCTCPASRPADRAAVAGP